jgi:6-phosphofructokinase 2
MGMIVTLTMNPALDVSTDTDHVVPGEKLRCGPTVYDPGGGGVNVSRVLHRLHTPTRAVFVAGGLTGDFYTQLIEAEQVPSARILIDGETRESFTVTEGATGKQYRFVLAGPSVDQSTVARVVAHLDDTLAPGDWLVQSGSLPPGVDENLYGRLADRFSSRGVKVVVDTAPPWLAPALASGVFLVKPSRHELEEYVGHPLPSRDDQIYAATRLLRDRGLTYVALSLGSEGALLVSEDGVWHAVAPRVDAVSAVGAGDSFLAGLLSALHRGDSPGEALAYGVAAGSATAMSPATTLCTGEAIDAVRQTVVTTNMG